MLAHVVIQYLVFSKFSKMIFFQSLDYCSCLKLLTCKTRELINLLNSALSFRCHDCFFKKKRQKETKKYPTHLWLENQVIGVNHIARQKTSHSCLDLRVCFFFFALQRAKYFS